MKTHVRRISLLIFMLLFLTAGAQAEDDVTLTSEDFWDTFWTATIHGDTVTFSYEGGARYLPVKVKDGFAAQARRLSDAGELILCPDGMSKELMHLVADSLTGGHEVLSIDVRTTEIVLALRRGDGSAFLRIAGWNQEKSSYYWMDTQDIPSEFSMDTIHDSDGVIYLDIKNSDGKWEMLSFARFSSYDPGLWILTGVQDEYFIGKNDIHDINEFVMGTNDAVHYGTLEWNNMETIAFDDIPMTFQDALATLDTSGWAVVHNPNPSDRLHLRLKPDASSESRGKFYNRTPVYVASKGKEWSYVLIGDAGYEGWMMTKYLAFGADMDKVKCAFPQMCLKDETRGAHVPMYAVPEENAYAVAELDGYNEFIIGVYGDDWYIVMDLDSKEVGYSQQKYYFPGNG